MDNATGGWNSLEVAKLLVAMMVPLAIFVLGIGAARRAEKIQREVWRSQKRIEWRQTLFNNTIEDLNKLYCAFNYCGDWTEISPPQIIAVKRRLDRNILCYSRLLSSETRRNYDELMATCFETERGRGLSIRLRCNVDMYRCLGGWKAEYRILFVPADQRTRRTQFNERYDRFAEAFFINVGVD